MRNCPVRRGSYGYGKTNSLLNKKRSLRSHISFANIYGAWRANGITCTHTHPSQIAPHSLHTYVKSICNIFCHKHSARELLIYAHEICFRVQQSQHTVCVHRFSFFSFCVCMCVVCSSLRSFYLHSHLAFWRTQPYHNRQHIPIPSSHQRRRKSEARNFVLCIDDVQ